MGRYLCKVTYFKKFYRLNFQGIITQKKPEQIFLAIREIIKT